MIGILSDEELARELENLRNDKPNRALPLEGISPDVKDGPIITIMPPPGRKEGDVNVPNSLRKLIGAEAVNGRQDAIELANMFGVSKSAASAYANGATSTSSYNSPVKSIRDHINKHKERISKKAHSKLGMAIDALTPENLKDVKARDLAGIAKDMSVVIKNMEPEVKEGSDKQRPVFVFYKPEMKQENYYERMKVDE